MGFFHNSGMGSLIGSEGTKTLSEMLKVNTTLTSLNLSGEDELMFRTDNKIMTIDLQGIPLEMKEPK